MTRMTIAPVIVEDVTAQASAAAQAEGATFDALIARLRRVAPQHDALILDLDAAANAYAVAYGDACFVVGVQLAERPAAVLLTAETV